MRATEMQAAQPANKNLRHPMQRSSKPKRVIKKVEERVLTEEELDYLRYVDQTGGDANLIHNISTGSLQ